PPRSVFGRASFTLSARPLTSAPFNAAMARSASEVSVISTNAKPRERPVSRSVTRLTRSTFPYCSKSERMEDSVAPKSMLPTKIFFMQSSFVFDGSGEDKPERISARHQQDNQRHNYSSRLDRLQRRQGNRWCFSARRCSLRWSADFRAFEP